MRVIVFFYWPQGTNYCPRPTQISSLVFFFLTIDGLVWFLVFNATFSNISAISWRPVLVVEKAGVPRENHRPWAVTGNLYHLQLRVECTLFSSPGHGPCELLSWVSVRRPSVSFSHLNLLL
jgi:hypothetical protein